jgi:peptidyl-prolyl cis-trans isomerase D
MQKNRKYLVVTIWVSTIAFIAAGSVGWGAYKYSGGGADKVAKVGEVDISVKELQNSTNSIFNYYNNLFGGKLTKEQAKELRLQDMALNQLIDEALLLNYAKELGIIALDSEIIEEYKSIDAFKKDGKFDKSVYENILRAQGISKKDFENSIKKSVIIKKLEKVLDTPVTPLEREALLSAKSLSDHLILKKIEIDPTKIEIDDKELKSYWEKHKGEFLTPKRYLLDVIYTKLDEVKVDELKLKEFYQEKRHLFKDSNGKILPFEEAKERVEREYRFKKAKTLSLKKYLDLKKGKATPQERLDLSVGENSKIDSATLSKLKKGDFIKAYRINGGYITAKVQETIEPKPMAFEKAKDKVLSLLQRERAQKELLKKAQNEMAQKSIEGKDIGFVSIDEAKKIDILDQNIASDLLSKIFKNDKKRGYYISGNSAVVYEIKEQRLTGKDLSKEEEKNLNKSLIGLKRDSIKRGVIKNLKKRYDIQLFIKKEEQS